VSASGVRVERHGPLAILRLDKARGNAIDEPMTEALLAAVAAVASDDSARGVLLASAHSKLFCPGLDLVALVEYDRPAMERFITTKAWMRQPALAEMRAGGAGRRSEFLDAWYSPGAQHKIRETVASLAGRG